MEKKQKVQVAVDTLECSVSENDGVFYKWDGSANIELTAEEQSSVDAAWTTYETEWSAQEYARNRAEAYPSMQEQLDMQYWDSVNGTTTWADAIAAVKAEYPKPE